MIKLFGILPLMRLIFHLTNGSINGEPDFSEVVRVHDFPEVKMK
jgi:hypothetical protein